MKRTFSNIEERLAFIEFRQELLFENSDLDRLLFEYEIDHAQYEKIMDLMQAYRTKIDTKRIVCYSTRT